WHKTDVDVSFLCDDTTSGVASCSAPVKVSQEAAGQVISGAVEDNAGNTAEISTTINLDKTAPTISFISPQAGATLQELRPAIQMALADNLALDADSLVLKVNGTAFDGSCIVIAGTATCTPNSDLIPGDTNLLANVSDLAGNTATSQISFRIETAVENDDDGDGMPNEWEVSFGLNPNDPSDRLLDSDGDGSNSFLEYMGGTDPTNAADIPHTQHYVLNPAQVGQALNVVSLIDGNSITMGALTLNLDANQSDEIPGVEVTQGTLLDGVRAFSVGSAANNTDMLVPTSFAGTEFVIPQGRNSHLYYLLSLQGDASVGINAGSGVVNVPLLQGQVYEYIAGSTNSYAATIRSNLSIMVLHAAASGSSINRDVYPVPPASKDLWGPRRYSAVGALEDNTAITLYGSGGQSESFVLNANEFQYIAIGNADGQGAGDVIHVVADKPVAAIQQADGDGAESVAYLDQVYFGNRYGIPVDAQYIEVICTSNTDVTLYDGTSPADTRACVSDGTYPGKVYFGSTSNGVNIGAAARVESDAPVYVMYETAATNDEHNLLGGISSGSSDSDGDGVDDDQDAFPNDPNEWSDLDGDGIGDNADTDRDGDG
ncbi:MAG: hypothetical protein GY701_09680, partial [Sulfitobacter sp.]|nr:hypothetical protein [Sulfitobacter sp.]